MTKDEHRALGITYFNKTWDYIDKPERTVEDDAMMLHYAHASRLHWGLSEASALNIVRGEWQIARVYALLGLGKSALLHATYCLEETKKHNIADFDLVFAYEAVARAHLVNDDKDACLDYLKKAYKAVDQVVDQDDKDYCVSELDSIKNNVG